MLKKIDGKLKVFSAATAMLLTPTLAYAAPKAIDPEAAISKVLNAVIGVGVGIATLYCAANAIFLIISYMSKQENHDRAELKGKVQYLIILEILACIIGGLIYWVKGLVGY